MDYQPIEPMPNPVMNQTTKQGSSATVWYIVGALVIIALGLWYFYGNQAPSADTGSSAVEQTQLSELSDGNTTADISADLSQIPDTSAALDADAAASAAAVSGF